MTLSDQALQALLDDPEYAAIIRERLVQRSDLRPGPLSTPCRVWTRSTKQFGYGQIKLRLPPEGIMALTHRVVFVLHHNRLPDLATPWVLHHCDVPACIAEDHLYEGTMEENTRDKMERGRAVINPSAISATRRANSSLSEQDVADIRNQHASGKYTQRALAKHYQISPAYVNMIIKNKRWVSAR